MSTLKLTAWVVDDDLIYQNFLSSFLIGAGFSTRGFNCGDECLKNLHLKPDVIILDNNPGNAFGGVEFLRRIKEKAPEIPVIYTSAFESASLITDAFRNGSADYIEKDCASLIRIKIRLDKIKRAKELHIRKKRSQVAKVAFLMIVATAIGWLMHSYVLHVSVNLTLR